MAQSEKINNNENSEKDKFHVNKSKFKSVHTQYIPPHHFGKKGVPKPFFDNQVIKNPNTSTTTPL